MKVNKHNGLMHLKVTIADKKVVTTGSYNYSLGSQHDKRCGFNGRTCEAAAKAFSDQFDRMWNDTKGFERIQKTIIKLKALIPVNRIEGYVCYCAIFFTSETAIRIAFVVPPQH